MAKSIHMLNKNIEVITACVQHIRGDLVSVHGIPSDHFASVDMTMAFNALLEAKRVIKHISTNGDNELSAHTTKFMKSIIDDVIWGVSSVQHHVDRSEHRLDSVVAAIFDSINELNEHVFCIDTVYSVSPVTHDVEVTTQHSESVNNSDVDVSIMSSLLEGVCSIVKRDSKISINTGASTCMPMSEEHREYLFRKFPNLANLGRRRPEHEATFPELGNK